MAREGVRYRISSDFDNRGVKAAEKGIVALGKSALKATVGITSASVAVSKLNQFLKESVQAALADEKAYRTLGQTLQTAGFGAAADQIKDFIDAQQLATGVAEDQLIPAYTTLFNTLQSVSAAQKTLTIAQDVALATGKDLNQVTTAFARAAAGNTTALSRLGIGITKAELASSDFVTILTKLEAKFGGTTGAVLDTTAVRMDRLRVAVGEAKEEIGKGLVDAFSLAANASTTSVDTMQGNIIRLGTSIGDVFRGLGALTSKLQTEMPDAISKAIGDGFKASFGPYGDVINLVRQYGESLRLETEKSIRQGMASVYTGGPRADRTSASTMGLILVQRQIYLAEQARKRAAAAEAARKRAEEAQRKKAAALEAKTKELASRFDLELISLAAAKRRTTDEETMQRLTALQALAQQGYNSEANSINELDELLKKLTLSQNAYTASVLASASAWSQITTGPNAGAFRMAEQAANQGLGATGLPLAGSVEPAGTPTGGMNNVTVNINALSTMDIEEAIAAAVNSGSRAGLAYTQVFSRL